MLRVCWAAGNRAGITGNAAGYSVSDAHLVRALGVAGVVIDQEAPVAIHYCYGPSFKPIRGRVNVLFTMWENEALPPGFSLALARADAVIVPSEWGAEVFRRHTSTPVHVCPLGYDPDLYVDVRRARPRGRMRFMWAGAYNPRKGGDILIQAWRKGKFTERSDVELYMKTLLPEGGVFRRDGNILVDRRQVSMLEMRRLYEAADVFVFPSMGEGFGLTLLEAMATALPCIAPLHTGMTAFAHPGVVMPVRFDPFEMVLVEANEEQTAPVGTELGSAIVCRVDVDHLIDRMRWVARHWSAARGVGVRAAKHAAGFTWAHSGRRLAEIIAGLPVTA